MHELSRHLIHETEILEASSKTLSIITKQHEKHCSRSYPDDSCLPNLAFYQGFLDNLRLRASAFDSRLQNEIRLVNIMQAGCFWGH